MINNHHYSGPYLRYFYVNVRIENNSKFWVKCYHSEEFIEELFYLLCINDQIPIYLFPYYLVSAYERGKIYIRGKYDYQIEITRMSSYCTPMKTLEDYKRFYSEIYEYLEDNAERIIRNQKGKNLCDKKLI